MDTAQHRIHITYRLSVKAEFSTTAQSEMNVIVKFT